MISEFYLTKALNIRKEFISILSNVKIYESMVKDIMGVIESKLEDLNDLQKKINEGEISNIETAKDSLMKIIMELEEEANNGEKSINELSNRIDKLRKDERDLFADLKSNYKNLTNEEIKDQIHKYIDKKLITNLNKEV